MKRLLRTIVGAPVVHWRVIVLACVTALVWCEHYDRWTLANWSVPTDYRGDALEILTRIQAAAEGDTVPLRSQIIKRLAAPFGADWSAYPSSDLLLIWGLGQLARLVGVYPAANLALLLAVVSAALAFYGCARWLRVRWEWAFATALLFAFTFQSFNRGLAHLFIAFSWTVPLALLASGIVAASRRLRWPGRGAAFCLGTALLIGIGNPYTLFMFLQLTGWAVVMQWIGPRRRENIIVGLAAIAVALMTFFTVESHVWIAVDRAAASPIVRSYGGTEVYALKPIELLLPPAGHRWDALAFFGHRYIRWTAWRGGEAFAPYLGIVAIVGFVWLLAVALRAVLLRRRMPGLAWPTGWVMAFSSLGGVTNIMAFFTGLIVFRATNRFSVFISAAALLFLAGRMSRWWGEPPAWWTRVAGGVAGSAGWRMTSIAVAGLVAWFGLADQMPKGPSLAHQRAIAERIESDRDLGRLLEEHLPPGAMVFQLPVMVFPEIVPPNELTDYDYFRPYLATRSLRFSYGALKGRSRGHWQSDVQHLPRAEFVKRLESYGFAALHFSRKGFSDRGERLLAELAATGRTRWIESATGNQVVVFLDPAANPKLPRARTLTFGRGWHSAAEGEPRWAYGPAALSYFNPDRRAASASIRLVLSAVNERTLSVRLNQREPTQIKVGADPVEVNLTVTLRPGVNRVDLEADRPAVRLSNGPRQLRSYAVHEATVTDEAGTAPQPREFLRSGRNQIQVTNPLAAKTRERDSM